MRLGVRITGALLAVLFGSLAHGSTLYADYNVLVSGDFTSSSTDTGGGLGTVTLDSYTVVSSPLSDPIGTYGLVGGIDVKGTNGSTPQGNIFGPIAGRTHFVWTPSQLGMSSTLAALPGRAGTVSGSTVMFTGSDLARDVFSTDASELQGTTTINITVPARARAVINVSGANGATISTTTAQISFNGHLTSGNSTDPSVRLLLWNHFQANSTLKLAGAVIGSVLAPTPNVTAGSSQFDGQLIAASYNGGTEFHSYLFNGSLATVTPEPNPAYYAGSGIALIAIGMRLRRKT